MTLYEVLLSAVSAALLGLVGVGIEVLRRKLGNVLHEITPNSGASMRDAVDRIEKAVDMLTDRVSELEDTTQRRRFGRRKRTVS